jgi:hypothetical protein
VVCRGIAECHAPVDCFTPSGRTRKSIASDCRSSDGESRMAICSEPQCSHCARRAVPYQRRSSCERPNPTRLASATLAEPARIRAEARVGNQSQRASGSGSIFAALEEQHHVTAEALIGGQKSPFSASANISVEPATKDNAKFVPKPPEAILQPEVAVSLPHEAEAHEAQRPEPSNNGSITQETTFHGPATQPQHSKEKHTTQQAKRGRPRRLY